MTNLVEARVPFGPGSGLQSNQSWQPLVIATLFYVGTGGVPALDVGAKTRTSVTIVREEMVEPIAQAPDPIPTSGRVLLLRRWLSLSIAETARVLGVQRPTIYAWERGEVPAQKNATRLRVLFELASHWRSLSEEPVGALRRELVTSDGKNLVALLSERRLRKDAIEAAMNSVLALQRYELAARPLSGPELARRFGFRPLAPRDATLNAAREAKGRPGWRGDKA